MVVPEKEIEMSDEKMDGLLKVIHLDQAKEKKQDIHCPDIFWEAFDLAQCPGNVVKLSTL